MPQLDLITLSTQISVMFFFGWSVFVVILNLILPQYFILNHSKKMFWFYLNNLITQIKLYVYLNYVSLLVFFDILAKNVLKKSILIKSLVEKFSKYTLNSVKPKINFFLFFQKFFFEKIKKNLVSLTKNSIEKNLSKIFFQKNSGNSFVQKYILNFYNDFFLTERQKITLMVAEMNKFWTFEDKIYIKNETNFVYNTKTIFNSDLIC
jgi:hypothetical protein